ncbi:MAG: response regulator [SAR324 cluster bacterium]|nr:response regulator [SAR324 cluster bacterium]
MEKTTGHVLYVEDEKALRDVTSFQLKTIGCQVSTAGHGKEALDFMEKQIPDLVLTDAMMPVMNGFDLVKAMQENERLKAIPVIFISANAQDSSKAQAFGTGAIDYLQKPVSMKELIFKVQNNLKLAATNKQQREHIAYNLKNAMESIDALKDQTQILAEIMKRTLGMRQLEDIHQIADKAVAGFFELCGAEVNFWRQLSGKSVMMGTRHPADEIENSRLERIESVFASKEAITEPSLLLYTEGYVMEVLRWTEDMPKIMEVMQLYFSQIADIFTSFKDAAIFRKVSGELHEILKIRNTLVSNLEHIRSDSNVNVSNISSGIEQISDLAFKETLSPEDMEQLREISTEVLTLTQYGDLANQKIFAIIHSLSQIFASLEDDVGVESVEMELSISEVSSDSIAGSEESNQQSVDDLLANLGL